MLSKNIPNYNPLYCHSLYFAAKLLDFFDISKYMC